jgi:hypothetical protein
MTIDKTMWEHSRSIKQCMKSYPSQGNSSLFPAFRLTQCIHNSSTNERQENVNYMALTTITAFYIPAVKTDKLKYGTA